jgi:hypothetical protein
VDTEVEALPAGVLIDADAVGGPLGVTATDAAVCTCPELPALMLPDAVAPGAAGPEDVVDWIPADAAGVLACAETEVLPAEVEAFTWTDPADVVTVTCTPGTGAAGWPDVPAAAA